MESSDRLTKLIMLSVKNLVTYFNYVLVSIPIGSEQNYSFHVHFEKKAVFNYGRIKTFLKECECLQIGHQTSASRL